MDPKVNFGGQLFKTSPNDPNYSRPADPTGMEHDYGDIQKYEYVPGKYSYSLGDATAAYSEKIEFFKRAFLHINNDTFIIFDKVKSADPTFKKVWTMHTVDQPIFTSSGIAGFGTVTAMNSTGLLIDNPFTQTHIDTLLPKQNQVIVRG